MRGSIKKRLATALAVSVIAASCAVGPRGDLSRAMDSENWEESQRLLEELLAASPGDGALHRDLGRVQIRLGQYDEAASSLLRAKELSPQDHSIPLLLGLAYEGQREWKMAIEAYHSYPRADGRSNVARAVRGRITRLVRAVYRKRSRAALEEPRGVSQTVLAVRYFEVLAETETYGNLGKGLAEQLIHDLSTIEKLHLVERLRYEALRREVERSRSKGFDPLSSVSMDEMLGAGWSLGGTITPLEGVDEVHFDFYLVNNLTGEVGPRSSLSGRLSDFFELEKHLAYAVARQLELPLSREEKQAIGEVPTTSFKAFLLYCDGLDAEDRGDLARAAHLFDGAVRIDPLFFLAAERRGRTAGTASLLASIAKAEIDLPSERRLASRLQVAAPLLASSPDVETGEAGDVSSVRPLGLGSATLTVRVDEP